MPSKIREILSKEMLVQEASQRSEVVVKVAAEAAVSRKMEAHHRARAAGREEARQRMHEKAIMQVCACVLFALFLAVIFESKRHVTYHCWCLVVFAAARTTSSIGRRLIPPTSALIVPLSVLGTGGSNDGLFWGGGFGGGGTEKKEAGSSLAILTFILPGLALCCPIVEKLLSHVMPR